ncbi:hypothetical protein FI667_g2939, partial [Globisporangium splendens]
MAKKHQVDTEWASPEQQHVAAGTLQAIMSALHPELKRFVRVCVREHMLKGMPMRNSAKLADVDRQVTALLESKMNVDTPLTSPATADFVTYLQFVDQNWYKYIADLDFHSDLRPIVKQSIEIRNNVARQVPMSKSAYHEALATLLRLADLIAVQKTTKDLIKLVEDTAKLQGDVAVSYSSSPSSKSPRAAQHFQSWVILLLCWVVLALIWYIIVLNEVSKHESESVKSWLLSVTLWTLEDPTLQTTPDPSVSTWWSELSSYLPESVMAMVPAPTPAPTPAPQPDIVTSWLGWF